MANNLVSLGDYIEECDERNSDGKYGIKDVKGISTAKTFIDTKANLNGVMLNSYKVINPTEFVYVADTSRRGDKIALSYNDSNAGYLISSIYTIFKSKNTEILLPEYLFLLLNRIEFDRYARFNSWGSARETFDWSELCRIKIPLPSIKVQQELVAVYNGLKDLAEQNEALIKPLSDACHASVVDCKKKYPMVKLEEYIKECDERNSDEKYGIENVIGVSIAKEFIPTKAIMTDVPLKKYKVVRKGMFVFNVNTARMGDKFAIALCLSKNYLVSSIYGVFISKNENILLPEYLFILFKRGEFDRYVRYNSWGSARETFEMKDISDVKIPLPPKEVQESIVNLYRCLESAKQIAQKAREEMKTICPALVQRAKEIN